jgi:hypothetical protein
MKVGKRTQAYFVGFLIGVAIVSILIDFRRSNAEKLIEAELSWQRAMVEDYLPQPLIELTLKPGSHMTAMRQVDGAGAPTGVAGIFFEGHDGQRYWLSIDPTSAKLCSGRVLLAEAHPGLDYDLMVSGFEHQGHTVLSGPEDVPFYRIGLEAGSAQVFIEQYENLQKKAGYIAAVEFDPVD